MKKLILISLLIGAFNISVAQDSLLTLRDLLTLNVGIGGTYLSDQNLLQKSELLGVSLYMGLRVENRSGKLGFMPLVNIRGIERTIQNGLKIGMDTKKLAGAFDFRLYRNKKQNFAIYNQLELGFSWFEHYVKVPAVATNSSGQSQSTYEQKPYYKAQAPSIKLGYKIVYRMFFVDLGYDIVKATITYDNYVLSYLRQSYPDLNPHPNVIFNSMSFHFGLVIPANGFGNTRYTNYQYMNSRPVN